MNYIGLKRLDSIISPIVKDGENRRKRGLPIPPLAIDVDDDNGKSTIIKYYVNKLETSKRLLFTNLDEYIEVSTKEGTVYQIDEMIYQIQSVAVYQNISEEVPTVVAVDLSEYDESENSEHIEYMCKELEKTNCPYLFFINGDINSSSIIKSLGKTFPSLRYVSLNNYSTAELTMIAVEYASKFNVSFEEPAVEAINKMIQKANIQTAKLACNLIREIIITLPDKNLITGADVDTICKTL